MKTLILTAILINFTLGNKLDTLAFYPFNLDFQKDVRLGKVLKILGIPTDTPFYSYCGDNILVQYPEFVCSFLYKEKEDAAFLYSIEILKNGIDGLKIGYSKRKIIRKFGKPTEEIIFSNNKKILDYFFEGELSKHTISLEFKNNKLNKIFIVKSF